jgi:flagellar motor switch/type III secretory pathway protein FliN
LVSSELERDVLREGERVLEGAAQAGVPLRLLGGVAVQLRAGDRLPPALRRTCGDLDFVTARNASAPAQRLFRELGYEPHVSFNALNGKERLLFFDPAHERQVDVFVGSFRMCHTIPIEDRLEVDRVSIPLAELLLTKLQVIELNEKDVQDAVAILHGREVGERDGETVNGARVAALCAADWGLWRTITANLRTCLDRLDRYGVDVRERIAELVARIEAEPKSRAWRVRAKIGDRKRWYELPEERA